MSSKFNYRSLQQWAVILHDITWRIMQRILRVMAGSDAENLECGEILRVKAGTWRIGNVEIFSMLWLNADMIQRFLGIPVRILPSAFSPQAKYRDLGNRKEHPPLEVGRLGSSQHHLLWINQSIRCIGREKQRLYDKAKCSHESKDWQDYRSHKKATVQAVNSSHWRYVNSMLPEGLESKLGHKTILPLY